MALALGKLILAGSNATTNTAGAYFSNVTFTPTTSANVTIPAGMYIAFPAANTSIFANSGASFLTVLPANTGGVIFSDGINVLVSCTSNVNANITMITVNGGEAANGTFNK